MEMPNEETFIEQLEKDILEIHNKCNYFAPQFIINKYKKIVTSEKTDLSHENSPLINDDTCITVINEENNTEML